MMIANKVLRMRIWKENAQNVVFVYHCINFTMLLTMFLNLKE